MMFVVNIIFADLIDGLDDDDLSDISFESDEEEEEEETGNKKGSKRRAAGNHSIFASAEEFASILEDEGSSRIAPGSSNVVSNKDNASKCFESRIISQ